MYYIKYMPNNDEKSEIQNLKEVIEFLSDSKILLGIGIGLILGVVLMFSYKYNNTLTDAQIEEKARDLGMHFEGECKSIFERDEN